MYTLKVNIRAQEQREKREKERQVKEAISKIQAASGSAPKPRKRKGLNFHEPGSFVAQGEQLRKKAKLEALQKKIAATAAKTGITDAVKLATLTTNNVDKSKITNLQDVEEEIPDVEWWDAPLLRGRPLDEIVLRLVQSNMKPEEIFDGITNLVEHPPMKKAPGPDPSTAEIPIFLTEKERKKLRRQNRKNLELEKQEKIKLGLLPKPEPKLKRSSIMYALANEAVINPSMTEQKVREQEERRLQAHLEHNESKKLTVEEKRAKKLRKIQEDLDITGTWVSVYRILNMNSQPNKFKVIQNAKQLTMTGILLLYKNINLVVVEGGPKQQRKYKHLMMDRIQWANDPNSQEDIDRSSNPNRCLLVWEGQVIKRSFKGFKTKPVNSETEARNIFKQYDVEHYWDIAFKMSILETIEEPPL